MKFKIGDTIKRDTLQGTEVWKVVEQTNTTLYLVPIKVEESYFSTVLSDGSIGYPFSPNNTNFVKITTVATKCHLPEWL